MENETTLLPLTTAELQELLAACTVAPDGSVRLPEPNGSASPLSV